MSLKNYLALTASTLAAVSALAADYYVAPNGTGDYSQGNPGPTPWGAAEKATHAGDVIHLAAGTYSYTTGNIMVKPGVTMIGATENPDDTVIERIKQSGDKNNRCIHLGRNATLRNLTVRGGYTDYQAATVLGYDTAVHKVFSVSNCIVEGGSALYKGGGSYGGTWRNCIIRNCTVRNPYSRELDEGSGGAVWGGTLYDCTITNNTAYFAGGGLSGSTTDPCVAYNCTLAYNTAPYGSGAGVNFVYYRPECVRLYSCNVVSNDGHNATGQSWGGKGGGTCNCWVTNSLIAWNKTRTDNTQGSGTGGGAGVYQGRVYDSTIQGNQTTKYGANGYVDGGGAEAAYLENCRILDNTSVRYAGGTLSCTNVNCVIAGNQGSGGGGTFRGLNIGCVISNNTATTIQGGACYNSDTINCRIVDNKTSNDLGALCRGHHQGDLIIGNSCGKTTEGGSALQPQTGSAADCWAVNCTIYGNKGGTCQAYASHTTNCIITASADGKTDVDACELINCFYGSKTSRTPDGTNSIQGNDPGFVGAAAEDGEDFFSLKFESPCVDKGLNQPWMLAATDILGHARIFKHAKAPGQLRTVDIGAFECQWKPGLLLMFH